MFADLTHSSRIETAELPNEEVIFGNTAAMQAVRQRIDRAVRENLPVVIQGESGTGKEVIAKYLHIRSGLPGAPFVKVNCISFARSLVAAEAAEVLTRESDTGWRSSGTLYLDEIGDLDWQLQRELIKSLKACRADGYGHSGARIVCSTRTAVEMVTVGTAIDHISGDDDGFVRLNLPPLRERKSDIPQLCDFLMEKLAKRFGKRTQQLTPSALASLRRWHWPGNLRELENWVARVVILGSQEALAAELRKLEEPANSLNEEHAIQDAAIFQSLQFSSAGVQTAILRAFHAHGWSRRRAAQELRISYRALICKLREANVPRRRRSHRESPPTG